MHFFAYPTHPYGGAAAPAPSYDYGRTRLHVSGCEWYEIETADNVFNWARTDELVNFFHAQGKEIEFQVYGTPAFHAIGPWATIPDNNANRPGAGTTPNVEKYQRFITNLVARYNSGAVKKLASISPWNEPKTDNPVIRVQYANSSRTGSFAVGNTVTGVTSGVTGTITAVGIVDGSNSFMRVKLDGMLPFANGEVIRKDASNFATINYLKSNYYFTGTAAQLAELSRACYTAAKAVDSGIVVTSPDFTIELSDQNFIQLWGQADSGNGVAGAEYADRLNFHFYNFSGAQVTNRLGYFYSVIDRVAFLNATIDALGKGWDIYGSECGYTPGWAFIDTITDPSSRAEIIKQTSAVLAAAGVKSCVWFQHDSQYDGNPSTTPAVASAMGWVYDNLDGAVADIRLTSAGTVEVD